MGQSVQIIDKISQQPVENVSIYTASRKTYVLTDKNGIAELTPFRDSLFIYFGHPAYQLQKFTYAQLQGQGFKIWLSEKTYNLDEIVVSASKFEEKRSDIPGQIQVVRSRDMAFMNQQTSADVLQSTGTILVQKSQQGGGSPIIRGFEANKVLIVVDGVRMNNAIYRGGHLQNVITLDNTILDRVEIVFGPGSVVYGSDALGGVMHFFTKTPQLSQDSIAAQFSTNAFVRYATAAQEKTTHADVNIGLKKWAFLSSITASDFNDLRQGNVRNPRFGDWGKRTFYVERADWEDRMVPNADVNSQKHSGYTQYDLLQKVLFKPAANISHQLNLQYSTSSDIPRYDRLTLLTAAGKPRFAEWYYGPQKRLFASYKLQLQAQRRLYNEIRMTAAYQQVEESRIDRRFASNTRNQRIENLDIYSLNLDASRHIATHEIRYGLEATRNLVRSAASARNILTGETATLDTRYPDGGSSMNTAAAYLTHTWEMGPKLIFTNGIRYTFVHLEANFRNKEYFPFLSDKVSQQHSAGNGNLGLIFKTSTWRLSAVASSGFRAPNIDDLSKVFESVPGNVIVPNPAVKPEYTYNGEVTIGKTLAGKIQMEGTGFYTAYTNAITLQPTAFNGADSILYDGQVSRVTSNTNALQAYIYGYSATLSADITPSVSLHSTLNYTYGRIRTDSIDYPLDHIPPVFGKTGVTLKTKKFRTELFSLYHGWKRLKDYNKVGEDNLPYATPEGMPAWFTLNVRAAYHFNKTWQAQVALENILDHHYRIFASGISAPGRNLMLTLRVRL
jgi:hemoglobin/transferrin/lactoferrin receptor protein